MEEDESDYGWYTTETLKDFTEEDFVEDMVSARYELKKTADRANTYPFSKKYRKKFWNDYFSEVAWWTKRYFLACYYYNEKVNK